MTAPKLTRTLLTGLFLVSAATAQFKSQDPGKAPQLPLTTGNQSSILSLMDPERFSMSHGFSFSMAASGNQAFSYGVYSNRLRYLISDNWALLARLDLVQPTYSTLPFASSAFTGNIYYGARLLYRPSENLQFTIGVDTYPRLYRYGSFYAPYSPFQAPRR
ncbi:MAG: hypothetical protein ACE5LH_06565 [Fidelibacterota bacterium]